MPAVDIYHKGLRLPRRQRRHLASVLLEVLPKQLTCVSDEGEPVTVTPKMVKIRFHGSWGGINVNELEVRVHVRVFKSREPHWAEYCKEIATAISPCAREGATLAVTYIPLLTWQNGIGTGPRGDG